ncbi:hypothetical protein NXS98_08145 [Fontisphaera persica]|uniref:hypothetical protein n=1 Tax=Fontisphaera persica TaxID=2974023 RepID=UPI0024C076CA|nr:hypothetical protein [Fontisphaera persica]WCJ61078.1 hypothetical protein NXS98_08145 [Fontisphaera persica]
MFWIGYATNGYKWPVQSAPILTLRRPGRLPEKLFDAQGFWAYGLVHEQKPEPATGKRAAAVVWQRGRRVLGQQISNLNPAATLAVGFLFWQTEAHHQRTATNQTT